MDRNEVQVAFDILLEEIELVANAAFEGVAEASRQRDITKVRGATEIATRVETFHQKVKDLEQEWLKTVVVSMAPLRPKKPTRRRTGRRLPKGMLTSEEKFQLPILRALEELGGRAAVPQVLDSVAEKMRGVLNEYDRQRLASNPRELRWRNRAQWVRYRLVREGLISRDAPEGIWEITSQGREALRQGIPVRPIPHTRAL